MVWRILSAFARTANVALSTFLDASDRSPSGGGPIDGSGMTVDAQSPRERSLIKMSGM